MTHSLASLQAFIRRGVAVAASCALVGFASSVSAADPVSDASSPQAQYSAAHDAMNAKNWDEARRLLMGLWTRAQSYDVASSLMYVEYHTGHFAKAANYAAFAIRNAPPVANRNELDLLRKGLDELKQRVGAITVIVNRSGAEVLVDSEVVGSSPLASDVYVDVGPHVIRARLAGSESPKVRVDALAGQPNTVQLDIPLATTADPPPSLRGPGAIAASAPESRDNSLDYTPTIITASVGGAALVGGIVSIIVAANKQVEADDRLGKLGGDNPCAAGIDATQEPECHDIHQLATSATTLRTVAYIGFGAAAAAGFATFVLWPRSRPQPASVQASPSVSVSPLGLAASIHLRF